jgi:transposase
VVVWDGNPPHRSKTIKAYLASGGARRIHLEQLPGYAPELNPIEWIWSYLIVADLPDLACDNFSALDDHLQKAKKWIQRKFEMIKAFLNAGYEIKYLCNHQ